MITRNNRLASGILALCVVGLIVAYFTGAIGPCLSDKAPDRMALDGSKLPTPSGIRLLSFSGPFAGAWKGGAHAETLVKADEGGRASIGEGRVEVHIPKGALSGDKLITLDIPKSGLLEVECGPDGIQFGAPVSLTISYEGIDLAGIDERSLAVLWLNPGTKRWESQGGAVDVAGKRVTAEIRHFSRYSLGGSDVRTGMGGRPGGSTARPAGASSRLAPAAAESLIMSMKRDIGDINPDVFERVEVELAGDRKLVRELGEDGLCRLRVKTIDIHVYSGVWDAMQPQKKVDLLDTTVLLLKRQYPKVTPFINLKFDDERQDLNLKYESPASSG